MAIQHKNIPDAQLHEVKGAAGAGVGQLLRFNGDGTSSPWTPDFTKAKMGFWDYADTATQSSPILLSSANTEYQLTNNGLGTDTNTTYGLPGVSIYNTSTGYFDFSDLKIGDTVDIRTDCEITTTSANNVLTLNAELGIGTNPYKVPFDSVYARYAGTFRVVAFHSIYIGNNDTKNGLARFLGANDSTGSNVKVNGWYIRVITNG